MDHDHWVGVWRCHPSLPDPQLSMGAWHALARLRALHACVRVCAHVCVYCASGLLSTNRSETVFAHARRMLSLPSSVIKLSLPPSPPPNRPPSTPHRRGGLTRKHGGAGPCVRWHTSHSRLVAQRLPSPSLLRRPRAPRRCSEPPPAQLVIINS